MTHISYTADGQQVTTMETIDLDQDGRIITGERVEITEKSGK
jgi:hypothetical protein